MTYFYLIYSAVISLITFICFIYDKVASKKELRRIPEIFLIFLTCIGGSLGALLGIYGIKHKINIKTKFHFVIGSWFALVIQIIILSLLLILKYEY